jgi:hypothetical protein
MRINQLAALFVTLIACSSGNIWATGEQPVSAQKQTCAGSHELASELATRKQHVFKLNEALKTFNQDGKLANFQLNTLFMIDLDNPDAIEKRIKELQSDVVKTRAERIASDPVLTCALVEKELEMLVTEIDELQKSISTQRLQFLTLPEEKRSAVLHPQLEATVLADTVKQIQEEQTTALADQKAAAKSLAEAEQHAFKQESGVTGRLLVARTELERIKSELVNQQVKWLANLEQQAAFYHEMNAKLTDISSVLIHKQTPAETKSNYEKTTAIWRALVDKTPQLVTSRYVISLIDLPDYPDNLLSELKTTAEAQQYSEVYQDAKNQRNSLQEKINSRLEESIEAHYRELLQSGEIRSQLLNQLLDSGDYSPLAISGHLIQDVHRELAIVPYRWSATFYLRLLDIRRHLDKGWSGWQKILTNLSVLLAFFIIPWLIWLLSRWLTDYMGGLRTQLVRKSRTLPWARHLALAIQKLLPYTFWLILLVSVNIAQQLLAMSVLSELALLLPYIKYYIYFRLFRQLMQCDFIWVNQYIRKAKLWEMRHKVDIAAKTLGLTAFFVFSLLYAIESLIRRGLTYHFATTSILYLCIAAIAWFAYQWREFLGLMLDRLIPGALGERLAGLCNSRYGLVLALPALMVIIVLLILREILNWSSRFDFAKKIGAEIFRYQLESAVTPESSFHSLKAPEQYRQWFNLSGVNDNKFLLTPTNQGFLTVLKTVNNWLEDDNTNSLAVVGYRGMGKTCLLRYLEQNVENCRVISTTIPQKMIQANQVLQFFSDLLTVPISAGNLDFSNYEQVASKTIVLIDNAHNLFLTRQGGFEGYKVFLDMINRQVASIFWCPAFNENAWLYLKNSVNARHQYMGSVVTLSRWSEQEIQNLILNLHAKTGFKVSYDEIIQATGSQEPESIQHIESRFFRMLWRQSRGNPRLAVHLWLSSLRMIGRDELRVTLPQEAETALYNAMSEDALFVYAGIARHENLTLSQLVEVTQLPDAVVKHILEAGIKQQLLDCRNLVYRIAPLYQFPLINYLQAKQFLYE